MGGCIDGFVLGYKFVLMSCFYKCCGVKGSIEKDVVMDSDLVAQALAVLQDDMTVSKNKSHAHREEQN